MTLKSTYEVKTEIELQELRNTSKIDDYQKFCNEILSSGNFSGMKARKLSELLGSSEIKANYFELANANEKLITIAEKLENLNLNKYKFNQFLSNTLGLIEQQKLGKERDGLVRNCLLYATKFRHGVNEWAERNPLYADMAELVMNGMGYTVAIVGTIATASALVASAEISIPVAIGTFALNRAGKLSINYAEKRLIELSDNCGLNAEESQEFRETTEWVIGKAKNLFDLMKFGKTIKNSYRPFHDASNATFGTYKLIQYNNISKQINRNTILYINQKRSQMLQEILSELKK